MQAVCELIWKPILEKNRTNATNATLHPLRQAVWEAIWKLTLVKSRTNATNVIIGHLTHIIWAHIWKSILEKRHTNATTATFHLFRQAIWGDIWKLTVEKIHTSATNVTFHPFRQSIFGGVCKLSLGNNPTNLSWASQSLRTSKIRLFNRLQWIFPIIDRRIVNLKNRLFSAFIISSFCLFFTFLCQGISKNICRDSFGTYNS